MAKVNPLDALVTTRVPRDFKVPQVPSVRESVSGNKLLDGLAAHDQQMENWRQNLERQIAERLPQKTTVTTTPTATATTPQAAAAPASGVDSVNGKTGDVIISASDLADLATVIQTLMRVRGASMPLTSATDEGTITGMGLPFVPVIAVLTVSIPADGARLFANLVEGSLTADGFAYKLSAVVPDVGYRLHYVVL